MGHYSDSRIKCLSLQPFSSDKEYDLRPGNLWSSLFTQRSNDKQGLKPYFLRPAYSESQNS